MLLTISTKSAIAKSEMDKAFGIVIDEYSNVTVIKHYNSWSEVTLEIYVTRTSSAGYEYGGYIPRHRVIRMSNGQYEVIFKGSIGLL